MSDKMKKRMDFIDLECKAAHCLKELRLHAPLHVEIIRKYIKGLKKRAK